MDVNNKDNISILDIPEHNLTPGMRQYRKAKEENPDCVIMLRMGDFFELFYEDAIIASRELEITLTARGQGEKRAPLAGVPHHAIEGYIAKLVRKGYKVAIVEQLEDPKQAKGLVKRGLVRIVTPGTLIEQSMLSEKENNYILCLTCKQDQVAITYADISTGELTCTSFENLRTALNEIVKIKPSECILPQSLLVNEELKKIIEGFGSYVNGFEDTYFKEKLATTKIENHFNKKINELEFVNVAQISTTGALLHYLSKTQLTALPHIKEIKKKNTQYMLLDSATYKNLELIEPIDKNAKQSTLLSVLDKTKTSIGARLLKKWIKNPLLNEFKIHDRQDSVEYFHNKIIVREEIIQILKNTYDIQRLISRINYGNSKPKDLVALKLTLFQIPFIQSKLKNIKLRLLNFNEYEELFNLSNLIQKAILDEPANGFNEGGYINPKYNEELNQLHNITKNSKEILSQIEAKEKERTGLTSLKIGYNRVFGYYIEISKKQAANAPQEYTRKQTLANAERFITNELKELENKILNAKEKIIKLEKEIYQEITEKIIEHTSLIQKAADQIAKLDVVCSLANVASSNNYAMPQFNKKGIIEIKLARHPVVENNLKQFISNSIHLNNQEMIIITGPNMAGKSTIMRQVALICLMAQIGSFIPATNATLPIIDKIFTRVGAYDDLNSGRSTFMVEMSETANILNNATEKSLIIMDEIGRGTSTFDGVSIAWSVAEYIHNTIKAKTMFATHYHVLNKLSENLERIKNFNIAVKEEKGDVIFLRKLIEGSTDKSYGIHVAKLAGLPQETIDRALEIQKIFTQDDEMVNRIKAKKIENQMDLSKFN